MDITTNQRMLMPLTAQYLRRCHLRPVILPSSCRVITPPPASFQKCQQQVPSPSLEALKDNSVATTIHILLCSARILPTIPPCRATMSLPLAGKVAIVTGSSLGIGAAIVRRLAADGASSVINYVSSADAAQALADEINKEGKGSAIIVQGDMSSVEDGKRVVEKTVEHFGRIDILVLNAARSVDSPLEAFTEEDFDKHFAVNVKVPLVQVQTASKYLKAGTSSPFRT